MFVYVRCLDGMMHGSLSVKVQIAGKAKISPNDAVSLPEHVLREVGWKDGDSLVVQIVDGDRVILSRRPEDIVEATAGALTHLYPETGDVRRFLDEERAAWDGFDRRFED
jgi:antitoxin component of MazEF toxin-antitoxin module